MKRTVKIIGVILLLISIWVLNLLYDAGTFKTIKPHFEGNVNTIHNLWGVEDLTIDQETGYAYLSSDNRWATLLQHKPIKGSIYLLNLNDSLPQPQILTHNYAQEDFHPHGLSLVKDADGAKYLMVINHRKTGNYVEIFKAQADSLTYIESITNKEWLISPNDIVAVGKRQFYFSNDHDSPPSKIRTLSDFLQIKTGQVVYFDGKTYALQAENIQYANGINVSIDGKKLFVASSSGKKIYVYDRDIATGKLIASDQLPMETGVDNIEIAPDGALWIGCHPQLLKFLKHASKPDTRSPSQVLRVVYKGNGDFSKEEIYLNDGSEISASSTASVYGKKLLIGPVFQEKILLCEMK